VSRGPWVARAGPLPGVSPLELDGDLARLNFKLFGEDEHTPGEPKLLFESGFQ
jgi:alkaline phosphatase D